jgi:hypothetical protein
MHKQQTDELCQLVGSMSRSEKRQFALRYGKTKTALLFEAINHERQFCDRQLHNLRAGLYKQLLSVLRSTGANKTIEQQLHAGMEHAKILFDKHLYQQSLKALEKVKKSAASFHQVSFRFQALALQKEIASLNFLDLDTTALQKESIAIAAELASVGHWSTVYLLLHGWHARNGHALNKKEEATVDQLLDDTQAPIGFYAKLFACQAKAYHAYILHRPDCRLLVNEWVNHFEKEPQMKELESFQYEKAKAFINMDTIKMPGNYRDTPECILGFYRYAKYLFDKNKYSQALDYLNAIINQKSFYRTDLQVYARRLQVECHEQLGNHEIIGSLKKSLARFSRSRA